MSASCLDLRITISAPDSDRMDRALDPGRHTPTDSTEDYRSLALLRAGPGGLGTALEEELALLTGEREEDLRESASETPESGKDSELLALFRQKEKDLVLAAKLGKALLERNQDLTKQYEKMSKDLNDKLELLEQEKHELRRRMESREGEWESRVAELETDVQHLQGELERNQQQLRDTERDKTRAAAEVEKELSTQVHSLRDDFREKRISSNQHMTRLETLQTEIQMLSDRKQELERRVSSVLEENQQLLNTVEELRERTLVLEKHSQHKEQLVSNACSANTLLTSNTLRPPLRESQLELQEARVSHRQLSARLEELTDEHELQSFGPSTISDTHSYSLQSEIEQSMEQEELEHEREQLRLQLWEAYCQVRSICSQLRGNDITDSALSTDSSMDESSETLSARDVPEGSLTASLLELRRLTQNLLDGNESTVRKLSEELQELREMYEEQQEKTHGSQEEALELHNQVALLSVEVSSSREEIERLRAMADVHEPNEQIQSAIRDRDEAIAKKKAVKMELAKSKIDIMSLNGQLLDAIQQKLNLSQQLEAWQDDMHRVIEQQLMEKHQEEWKDPPFSFSGPRGAEASRKTRRLTDRDKRIFSFFKKN
ncbi:hypothetical protein DNTS_026961 [Danionella cerebrum]|uniref:HAP1 N-terminal domain-containing protein n=1 Tax=Danionella cerebrum TaxID=2873325 RepID=A0A553N530_9TELE|nr:hypothetical protein DNTS_026961 [Danionella translucida]